MSFFQRYTLEFFDHHLAQSIAFIEKCLFRRYLAHSDFAERIHGPDVPLGAMTQTKSVAFHTLGCKLNYAETSSISRVLEAEGFVKANFDEFADIYVINTCSVTENADKECRQLVRRIQKRAPQSMVVITGCYAQLKPNEIAAIPGVALVLGASEKFNIANHLKELSGQDHTKICSCDIGDLTDFHAAYSFGDRTRTFLKVQDGCDYHCSFCTIPFARGQSRSSSISSVLENVQEIVRTGVKEIVLTGVNLGDFGHNSTPDGKRENLYLLLKELEKVEGLSRVRLSSVEPNLLSLDIIRLARESQKLMPHFHIPLQSGSNRILGLMKRRYRRELYKERVSQIKDLIPHCAIGVDVISGFPSETADDFQDTLEFLESLEISYLHVFTYSEREHTKAVEITPVVPVRERHYRTTILRALSDHKSQFFRLAQLGQNRKVLFESQNRNGLIEGYSDNYIKVAAPYRDDLVNSIVDWVID